MSHQNQCFDVCYQNPERHGQSKQKPLISTLLDATNIKQKPLSGCILFNTKVPTVLQVPSAVKIRVIMAMECMGKMR